MFISIAWCVIPLEIEMPKVSFYYIIHFFSNFDNNFSFLKNKCAQYWPAVNDKLQGGTLTVRQLEEKIYAEYIVRRLKMHNKSVEY